MSTKLLLIIISSIMLVISYGYFTIVITTPPSYYKNGIDDKLKRYQITLVLLLISHITIYTATFIWHNRPQKTGGHFCFEKLRIILALITIALIIIIVSYTMWKYHQKGKSHDRRIFNICWQNRKTI